MLCYRTLRWSLEGTGLARVWLCGVAGGRGGGGAYQTEGDTAELHHVGVGDAVEAAHPGVEHRDQGGPYDRLL